MIKNRSDLKEYIRQDKIARWGQEYAPSKSIYIKTFSMVRFNIILRKTEFHINRGNKIRASIYKFLLLRQGMKLGWSVEPNTFEQGMCIVHYGSVVVNGKARIGKNARLHVGVNVGASGGEKEAPVIGDNVYFGPGAKVFGNIKLGSNIAIAANAVVNKTFLEDNVTLGGIPAKIISDKGSSRMIN